MDVSVNFKETIQSYLEQRASNDALFAISYAKNNKNIDDCINFIINVVYESKLKGFTDLEIYSMAVHYYDEDNINVEKYKDCVVVVNHQIILSDEEKEEARRNALKRAENEAYEKIMRAKTRVITKTNDSEQRTLFDL